MKALTLWQPYASLIAIESKHYETRSWPTKYRGPLAIHASAKNPADVFKILDYDVFRLIQKALNAEGETNLNRIRAKCLPVGKVVAIVNLTDCIPITEDFAASVSEEERAFGDWTPGRYAWKLEQVEIPAAFLTVKGKQGLWNFDAELWRENLLAVPAEAPEQKINPKGERKP